MSVKNMNASENYLERIAIALESLVVISTPKPVDIQALMAEATEALIQTNPGFRIAMDAIKRQEREQLDADASH